MELCEQCAKIAEGAPRPVKARLNTILALPKLGQLRKRLADAVKVGQILDLATRGIGQACKLREGALHRTDEIQLHVGEALLGRRDHAELLHPQ